MKQLVYFFCTTLLALSACITEAHAQSSVDAFFTQDGKLYVVVGVLLLIFISMVFFLVSMERRIKRLEQKDRNDH